MNIDLPNFAAGRTASASYAGAGENFMNMVGQPQGLAQWVNPREDDVVTRRINAEHRAEWMKAYANHGNGNAATIATPKSKEIAHMANANKTRVVRVFLVDPDERIPVTKRILHKTDEIITDETDQELFFGIPVADLLKSHNEFREGHEVEEKEGETTKRRKLKSVRIRDLTMTVVTIATF